MSHKTMIDGTAYEITGGKTLVNGTGFAIKSGKTLVGGTAYVVGFVEMVTISITDSDNGVASVYVYGEKIEGSATMEVPVGTIVECYTSVESASDANRAYLSINGEKTYHNTCNGIYPEYVVVGNTTINCDYAYGRDKFGYIEIFEADKMRTLTLVSDFSETDYFATDITFNDRTCNYIGTYEVVVGSTAYISLSAFESGATVSVFLNGQLVFVTTKTNSYENYYFTINRDITIEKVENSSKSCYVYITEET